QARIAVLCQHHVAELFAACPLVDSIICYDRKKMDDPAERAQILSEIAEFKPDVILNSVRSRDHFSNELTQAYRDARHIAIEGDFANISISDHARTLPGYEQIISSPEDLKPELGRHADFLYGLGIQTASLQPVVWTSQQDEILADTFFASHELDPAKTIAVFPGAQHEIRVYHGYATALKTLNDFRFLVFGDAAQEGLGAELERQLPGRIINLCGRSTLREAAALMRRCRLYVGAESAGAHIACAVGVPNVVLLGGGHFGRFMPYSPLTSAVSLPLDCFGCNWRCQYRHAHCVKDISAEVLATAIRETLAKPAARPQLFLASKDSWTTDNSRPNWRLPEGFISSGSVEVHVVQSRTGQIVKAMEPVTDRDLTCGNSRRVEPAKVEIVGEGIANPEVSVVVSAYQSEKYIRACLENLSRQTIFDRCEILVVDSGSTENERAIVADFQLRFPNIRYIRTPRETIYGAWNRGLEFAKGRYWANANTDDSMRDDALEILVAALDSHQDCALAYADAAWTTTPNDRFPSATISNTVKYSDYTPVESLFFCITGCLQFFRTDSLRQLGGFDASLHCAGDYEVTLKLMTARMNAVHVPEVLSLFFQNTAGLSQADDRASKEHELLMSRYRDELDIGNVFEASDKSLEATAAFGWVSLALRAEKFTVPWETTSFEQAGFALQCFHRALNLAPKDDRIGLNVVAFYQRLQRLDIQGDELIERWPKVRQWIDRIKKGEVPPRIDLAYTVVGPVFRVDEWKSRPTPEQLALFPEALRPWICRISGRHVYFSRDLFPLPNGERYQPQQLEKAGLRLAKLLAQLPPFYAHFGGAGDLLLLLASFYDQTPKSVLFSHPNSIGATQALLEGFPELSQIYFLPQHTEPFFHIVLRYAVYELKNCLGAGTTPKDGYDVEWKAGLNIEKKYGIKKSPQWAAR
ncbi:MAG: hypothetical protein JWM99_1570, partial [Verrucomicrobiales bacterium]|nr:hypothetical protein [Verrucomicrobiales bacterium]